MQEATDRPRARHEDHCRAPKIGTRQPSRRPKASHRSETFNSKPFGETAVVSKVMIGSQDYRFKRFPTQEANDPVVKATNVDIRRFPISGMARRNQLLLWVLKPRSAAGISTSRICRAVT